MDILYRYLEYPKYVPQGTCRFEWVKENTYAFIIKVPADFAKMFSLVKEQYQMQQYFSTHLLNTCISIT